MLDRWTAAGVLPAELADQIRNYENAAARQQPQAASRSTSRFPAVAEALGYLGGVLGIVGVFALISAYWSDWSPGVQLGVTGMATVLLIVAGFVVRGESDSALGRLRWFLWAVTTPSTAMFAYVLSNDVFNWERVVRSWLVIAIVVGLVNAGLWAGRRRPIQEALVFASIIVAVGTAIGEPTDARWAGIAVWATGITFVAVSLWTKLALPLIPATIGSLSIIVGAYLTVLEWEGFGLLFLAFSSAALAALASIRGTFLRSPFDVLLGVMGIIGLVQGVPATLMYFAKDAGVMTGSVLWFFGVLFFLVARAQLVRAEVVYQVVGGVAVLVGPAITGTQSLALATIAGLFISGTLIALGITPGRVLMSMFGLLGLLIYVPWSIAHFFPGEGRAPLLITVSGLLIVVIAVILARMSGRIRTELQGTTLKA